MQCIFVRNGRIADVEILDVNSDKEAIEKGKALFEERKSRFEGFEIWDRGRKVDILPFRDHDPYSDG
jgi:hypothetical protein